MAKVTKRDRLVEIANILEAVGETPELVEFVDNEIAMYDKRASKPRKATAEQVANEGIKSDMLETMVGEMTATEVSNLFEDMSVQKASQLLRQLVAAGLVIRTEGKGKTKTTFRVA